tara:strand:- start:318 stop:983 length:666 start_codon:yes stop_codon:yes gene_type:complete
MNLKFRKFILKNKKIVAMTLILLLLLHSSGLIRKTFTIMEGGKFDKLREDHIKNMEKALKDIKDSAKKLEEKQKEQGITEKEKRLTLELIDSYIDTIEQTLGRLVMRNHNDSIGFSGFSGPAKVMFATGQYIKNKMATHYGMKGGMWAGGRAQSMLDVSEKKNFFNAMNYYLDTVDRMKKFRDVVAKLKTIDGGKESLPEKSSGKSSEKSSEKSSSYFKLT